MDDAAELTYRLKKFQVPPGQTLADAIKNLNMQPEEVLAVLQGVLIFADYVLLPGDQIELISVISGG